MNNNSNDDDDNNNKHNKTVVLKTKPHLGTKTAEILRKEQFKKLYITNQIQCHKPSRLQ